jgi:hypothetical protein
VREHAKLCSKFLARKPGQALFPVDNAGTDENLLPAQRPPNQKIGSSRIVGCARGKPAGSKYQSI